MRHALHETAEPSRRTPGRRGLTAAMCLSVTLVVGMVSAVNLAIPEISADPVRPSATAVVWVVDGYLLTFACLLLPAGALADRLGRKGVLLVGLGLFTLGNLACAAAPHVGALIAGRALSGAGAAAVLPTTLALLVHERTGAERSRAVAVWASMTGLAAVLGNVGGGAALELGSWRALFLTVTPLACGALLLVAALAPAVPRTPRPVSWPGAVLLTGAVAALLYAVVSGPQQGWGSAPVLCAFAAAAFLGPAWAGSELRARHPLLDPALLTSPRVLAAAAGMALLFTGMFGLFLLNGQYLQYVQGAGPLGAGVRLLPMAAALLAGPRCGLLLRRLLGDGAAAAGGMLVLAAGLAVVSRIDPHTPYALYACGAVLTALGCGIATPVFSEAMVSALPGERAGAGSGLQSLTRELGSAFGIAVTGSLVTAGFTARLPERLTGEPVPTTVPAARARATEAGAGEALDPGILAAFTGAVHTATLVLAAGIALAALPVGRGVRHRAG
ncbi:MFS transporter [Streptomyces xiaopingdaonensis]|uniref:MFS transporter n=1 Tax=Streptomyces xiaopingdaonensis TaxID=1565415 RepID=UPI0002F36A0A|nr:MFS transporter [Streptomyces xiaopingdaonensis]